MLYVQVCLSDKNCTFSINNVLLITVNLAFFLKCQQD